MKDSIKLKRNREKLAALLKSVGRDDLAKEVIEEGIEPQGNLHMQAEAVLIFLKDAIQFETRYCAREECKEQFLTNYRYQAYCSIGCVKKQLATVGITYDTTKDEHSRWGTQHGKADPPLLITPAALKTIRKVLNNPYISQKQRAQSFKPPKISKVEENLPKIPEVLVKVEPIQEKMVFSFPPTPQF